MSDAFLGKIVDWANNRPDIFSLIMTGSRARPDAVVDTFSDYDLEIFTTDPELYTSNSDWLREIGDVWTFLPTESDRGCPTRLVIFDEGRKVDFSVLSFTALEELADTGQLDGLYGQGYRVLIDKKGLAARLPSASYSPPAHLTPTEEEFRGTVEEFWFEAWHIPKYLHRNDLWVVKFRDWTMKQLLLRMLEWHAIASNGRALDVTHIGVRMRGWTRPDFWERLHACFGHFDHADSQRALIATMELFRDVAVETAATLGYKYPRHVDDAISGYIAELVDLSD